MVQLTSTLFFSPDSQARASRVEPTSLSKANAIRAASSGSKGSSSTSLSTELGGSLFSSFKKACQMLSCGVRSTGDTAEKTGSPLDVIQNSMDIPDVVTVTEPLEIETVDEHVHQVEAVEVWNPTMRAVPDMITAPLVDEGMEVEVKAMQKSLLELVQDRKNSGHISVLNEAALWRAAEAYNASCTFPPEPTFVAPVHKRQLSTEQRHERMVALVDEAEHLCAKQADLSGLLEYAVQGGSVDFVCDQSKAQEFARLLTSEASQVDGDLLQLFNTAMASGHVKLVRRNSADLPSCRAVPSMEGAMTMDTSLALQPMVFCC